MTEVDVQFVDLQSKYQFDNCTEFIYGATDEDRISMNNKIIHISDKDGNNISVSRYEIHNLIKSLKLALQYYYFK